MPDPRRSLTVEPLSAYAFKPFGDVIEASEAARHFPINEGYAERYHDLATIDVGREGGHALVNIFKAKPRSLPFELLLLERHPLGSQAFVPLSPLPYLVVVAPAITTGNDGGGDSQPDLQAIRCFLAGAGQGVNYARSTWHHPLIALHAPCNFLVLDRGGPPGQANCDTHPLAGLSLCIPAADFSSGAAP